MADPDYNSSALFSGVADLYVIEAGAEIGLSRDTNGLMVVDDPLVSFDNEGEFVSLGLAAGEYQVWTTRNPEVLVVTCTSSPVVASTLP